MKIAILLPGHFRSFKKTVKNFKKNIISNMIDNDHEYDIFISSWDTDGFKIGIGGYSHKVSSNPISKQQLRKKVQNAYDPKIIDIEPNRSFDTEIASIIKRYPKLRNMEKRCKTLSIKGSKDFILEECIGCVLGQLYKIKQTYNLIEDHNDYDLIIKSRFDITSSEQIDWANNKFMKQITEHICVGGRNKKHLDGTILWGDILFGGPSQYMKHVCCAYDYITNPKVKLKLTSNPCENTDFFTTVHIYNSILNDQNILEKLLIITNQDSTFNNISIVR